MVLKDNDMSLKVKLCQEWITTQEHLPQKFGKINCDQEDIFFLLISNQFVFFCYLNWLFSSQV